jgi:TrmH family RNA methyltransferase
MVATASSLNGSAANPYAVSVGNPITPPARKTDTIAANSLSERDFVSKTFIRSRDYLEILSLGKHNPRAVAVRKAIQHAELTPDGLLPIEGPKLVQEALRSGIELTDIFVQRGKQDTVQALHLKPNTAVFELEADVFKSIQSTETSQGMIALVKPPRFSLAQLLSVANPLIIVLGRLQDPGNVGTILRIAESFFATGCVALTGTASIYNSKTVRASAGSLFRLPYVWNADLKDVSRSLQQAAIPLVGTSPGAEHRIDQWGWRKPVALMIGNEGSGLSEEELHCCDAVLRIPHNPAVESLNSAIATAVILYEALKHERISL